MAHKAQQTESEQSTLADLELSISRPQTNEYKAQQTEAQQSTMADIEVLFSTQPNRMAQHKDQHADAQQSTMADIVMPFSTQSLPINRRPKHDRDDYEEEKGKHVFEGWYIDHTLGVGGFSTVKRGKSLKTHQWAAFKIMWADATGKIRDFHLRALRRELKVLKAVQHHNVIKKLTFSKNAEYPGDGRRCCVLVLELAKGGCLFDFAVYTDAFDMKATRSYFHQMVDGVEAIHKEGYAHRDLKLLNMLLDANYVLKIADFGLAAPFATDSEFLEKDTRSGTRGFRAPEMLRGKEYSPLKCDIFALGVTLFKLFTGGKHPFREAKQSDEMWNKLCRGLASADSKGMLSWLLFWTQQPRFAEDECSASVELQNLLGRMMHPNPEMRYDIQHIKCHPWYCFGTTGRSKRLDNLKLNQRIRVSGCGLGTIQYLGVVHFAHGFVVGVDLDEAKGKHDGAYRGKRYFTTKDLHGVFVKTNRIVETYGMLDELEDMIYNRDELREYMESRKKQMEAGHQRRIENEQKRRKQKHGKK